MLQMPRVAILDDHKCTGQVIDHLSDQPGSQRDFLCRFNTSVQFGLPDESCRAEILHQYAKHLTDQEVASVAAASPGMAGRDLKDLSEQAERRWASKVGTCHNHLCDAVVITVLLCPFQLHKLKPFHTLHISVEQL